MNENNEKRFQENLIKFREEFSENGEYFRQFLGMDFRDNDVYNKLVKYVTDINLKITEMNVRDCEHNFDAEDTKVNNRRFEAITNEYKKAYQDMLKYVYDDINRALIECPGERDGAGHQLFVGLAKNAGLSEEHRALGERLFDHGISRY